MVAEADRLNNMVLILNSVILSERFNKKPQLSTPASQDSLWFKEVILIIMTVVIINTLTTIVGTKLHSPTSLHRVLHPKVLRVSLFRECSNLNINIPILHRHSHVITLSTEVLINNRRQTITIVIININRFYDSSSSTMYLIATVINKKP